MTNDNAILLGDTTAIDDAISTTATPAAITTTITAPSSAPELGSSAVVDGVIALIGDRGKRIVGAEVEHVAIQKRLSNK